MGLRFGWIKGQVIDSVWKEDTALIETKPDGTKVTRCSAAALAAWEEDMDASHLLPFAVGTPTTIRVRNLNADELTMANACYYDCANAYEGAARAWLMAFRIAVDFEGVTDASEESGAKHGIVTKERGVRMLALPFVQALMEQYAGIVAFYGSRILNASQASDAEKKASSPPSTPTPSKAEESTVATTEPSPPVVAA